jgi:S-adenosylmethionine:tRNA ribosyltransferase-isomerase
MRIDEIDFDLPVDRIAQHPLPQRDQSRLLVLHRADGTTAHHHFNELPHFLTANDLLVFNDTRVIPARLVGRRARTEGKWEGLFIRTREDATWELMFQTRGRLIVGETLIVDPPDGGSKDEAGLRMVLVGKTPEGRWLGRPTSREASVVATLAQYGRVPIPPYIRKGRAAKEDLERYQTVYARSDGAVAAPTAGLHFSLPLFEELNRRKIRQAFVTLHVGPGTFQTIQVEEAKQHHMQAEWVEVSAATAEAVVACRGRGGRVVAVGTTTVRALESAAQGGIVSPWSGNTDLTICPPYEFRAVDALITNFHLPRSSLLLLVSAFAGRERILAAYRTAIEKGYRFYSYGDAMLIF